MTVPSRPARFGRAGLLLLATGAVVTLSAPAAFASSDFQAQLRRAGLEPLARPVAAPGFRLPRLEGGEASLADFRGRWVLLTFFATWCGPCRAELPSLEGLHQKRSGAGIDVVAVSVDDRREVLPPFVERLGLTFPVLWDRTGTVGASYQASSIPVSYLVDPGGTLVAVARGARDWSRASGLAQALAGAGQQLAVHTAASPAAPGGSLQSLQVQAPSGSPQELPPPILTATLLDPEPTAGCPFEVAVQVRIPGSPSDYLLKPPSITVPEGVRELGVSAETGSSKPAAAGTVLTYRLRLAADQVGRLELGPVSLSYQTAGSTEPRMLSAELPPLQVQPLSVAGQPVSRLLWGGLAALILTVLATAGWRLRASRQRRAREAAAPDSRIAPLQAALDCARRERLEGRCVCEFLALAHASQLLGLEGEEARRLERALEKARYGNQAPEEGELAALRRDVERRLAALVAAGERQSEERLKQSVLTHSFTPNAASAPARD